VRVALWRAIHVQIDAPPHVLDDEVGLQLAAPEGDWRSRPDMDPAGTSWFRAAIVARARFIEDLVAEQSDQGVGQYVILGAGLDTFSQRRPEVASRLLVFEVDQPRPQAWKRRRLIELGFGVPEWLRLVPVDFEAGESLWEKLSSAGFDPGRPAVVVSTGVSMYLSKEANAATLREFAGLAPGSTLAMTFRCRPNSSMMPIDPATRRPSEVRTLPAHPSSASICRTKCSSWPARLASTTSTTCRRHCSTSVTLPAGPMVSWCPRERSYW